MKLYVHRDKLDDGLWLSIASKPMTFHELSQQWDHSGNSPADDALFLNTEEVGDLGLKPGDGPVEFELTPVKAPDGAEG